MKTIPFNILLVVMNLLVISCSNPDTSVSPAVIPPVSYSAYTNSIRATWEQVPAADKYEIRYATAEDKMETGSIVEVAATDQIIEGLSANKSYYLQVRAGSGTQWSDWSQTQQITTAAFSTTVTTYNILSSDVTTKGPLWPERKANMQKILQQANNSPDILALQEAFIASQRNDIINMLKASYGYHVSSVASSSPAIIFWKKSKYVLISSEILDMLAGNYPGSYLTERYAHHVRLRELNTGRDILVYSVHLRAGSDTETAALRQEQIFGLSQMAKAKALATNLPVVVLGDMNCTPGNTIGGVPSPSAVLTSQLFQDTFGEATTITNGDYYTWSRNADIVIQCMVEKGLNGSKRIDYIFTYPQASVSVSAYSIILNFQPGSTSKVECPMPSDHHPVRSTLHFFYPN